MQSQEIGKEKAVVPDLAKGTKGRGRPLTVTFFVGGKQVDKLTAEQGARMAERLSEAMSTYYTAHIDEYTKIQ